MKNTLKVCMILSTVALTFAISILVVEAYTFDFKVQAAQGVAAKKSQAQSYGSSWIAAKNTAEGIANPGFSLNFEETLFEYGLIWDTKISTANIVLPNLNTELSAACSNLKSDKKHTFQVKGTQNGGNVNIHSYT